MADGEAAEAAAPVQRVDGADVRVVVALIQAFWSAGGSVLEVSARPLHQERRHGEVAGGVGRRAV